MSTPSFSAHPVQIPGYITGDPYNIVACFTQINHSSQYYMLHRHTVVRNGIKVRMRIGVLAAIEAEL